MCRKSHLFIALSYCNVIVPDLGIGSGYIYLDIYITDSIYLLKKYTNKWGGGHDYMTICYLLTIE